MAYNFTARNMGLNNTVEARPQTLGSSATGTSTKEDVSVIRAELTEQANIWFNEAVRDGWNLEMDWLWLATKVTLNDQRRYCLERALAINPDNQMAKRALKKSKI